MVNESIKINSHHLEIKWFCKDVKNKPTLIFLHEGLGSVSMWKDFPKILSRKVQCPALVYSRLGYGNSDSDSSPYKINFMHTHALHDLPLLIQMLDIEHYILIGHSDGGSISLIHAGNRKQIHQGLVGVITEAAHLFCEKITVSSIEQAKISFEKGGLKSKLYKYHGKNTDNAFYRWNDIWLNPQFMNWDIKKYVPRINASVLAIQGKNDQYGSENQIQTIQKSLKSGKTRLIDNCKHSPHFEQPEIVLNLMSQFIKKIVMDVS